MRRWFVRPQLADEYEQFAARVLHYTLLLLLAVTLSFVFFVSSPSQLLFIPVMLLILGGCYYLLHRGRLRLAGGIFITGFWLVITLASFSINGIRNASISSYAIVIIFAAVLFHNRAVALFTILSVVSALVLTLGEMLTILPLRTTPLFLADRLFQQIALFSAAGILLSAAARVIRHSQERVQKHEQSLLERNRELELEIAERKQVEASLRVSEEKYRLLFENISAMSAVYDQDGQIILLNQATAQILGSTVEALQGRNMRDVFPTEYAEKSFEDNLQVIKEGRDLLIESKIELADGSEFYYLRHVMPLPSISDSAAQVLVITTDLTEKYQAQQREQDLRLAQEKNAFLTDFFSTLSHDLKTPLAVMNTSLYLLERAENIEQRQEKIRRIGEQVTLMDQFIQDMLTISRLEHLPTLNFQKLDLNALIEATVEGLRPRIESQQLVVHVHTDPCLPAIEGDSEQIHRLLLNLIENAINYTPPAGTVTVTTALQDELIVLTIQDSGIGIQADAIPHIFERFFRTSNARDFSRSGTGLGLAIVKKIADVHTATIAVSSELGKGTTFHICFPQSRLEKAATPAPIA